MKNPSKTYRDSSHLPKRTELIRTILKALTGSALVLFIHNILAKIIFN